jgi:hypothetical protein
VLRLRQEAAIFVEGDVSDKDQRDATNAGVVYNRVHTSNQQFVEPVAGDLVRAWTAPVKNCLRLKTGTLASKQAPSQQSFLGGIFSGEKES